jgi:hypothetical protein
MTAFFELQTDAEYLLPVSITVHFYTFPKINMGQLNESHVEVSGVVERRNFQIVITMKDPSGSMATGAVRELTGHQHRVKKIAALGDFR